MSCKRSTAQAPHRRTRCAEGARALTELEVMQEIRTRGLARQLGTQGDFESVLRLVDHLESEGLVEDVQRHREFDSPRRRVDQVNVARLSDRGIAYFHRKYARSDGIAARDRDIAGADAQGAIDIT